MRICEICFAQPVAEPGARRCPDCDTQRAHARGNPQPRRSGIDDPEIAAGLEYLRRHDALYAADDAYCPPS